MDHEKNKQQKHHHHQQQQEKEECENLVVEKLGIVSEPKVVVRKKRMNEGRHVLRERKVPDALSPLERIRNAQKKLIEDDSDDGLLEEDESCSLLTDEGEPSSQGGQATDDGDDAGDEVKNRETMREADFVPSHRYDTIWRQEAEKLGINKMSEEEAFKAYIEYTFICSIDPEYRDKVKASSSHRLLYSQAIRRIEYLIIQAQDYVHSESWRCCDVFLLESMERHVFIERLTPDETHREGDDYCPDSACVCAACGKGNAWVQVEFKCHTCSRGSFLASNHDTDMVLSQQYALASPVYQRNRSRAAQSRGTYVWEDVSPSCFFWLGSTCMKRISIFHALFHFRQHCITFLRRAALRVFKSSGAHMSIDSMMDAVLNDYNHSRMYTCFTSLLQVAESYQIAGGSEKHLLGKSPVQCDPPQYALLEGKWTDIEVLELDIYLNNA